MIAFTGLLFNFLAMSYTLFELIVKLIVYLLAQCNKNTTTSDQCSYYDLKSQSVRIMTPEIFPQNSRNQKQENEDVRHC